MDRFKTCLGNFGDQEGNFLFLKDEENNISFKVIMESESIDNELIGGDPNNFMGYLVKLRDLLNRKDEPTLPIECERQSAFQFCIKGFTVPFFGSVYDYKCRLSLTSELEGLSKSINKSELFTALEKLHGDKITAFHYIGKNPLNMPEWKPIPEPPECQIYRTALYFKDGCDVLNVSPGQWVDGVMSKDDKGCFTVDCLGGNVISRKTSYHFYKELREYWNVTSFHLHDLFPELGEWPGNEGEE